MVPVLKQESYFYNHLSFKISQGFSICTYPHDVSAEGGWGSEILKPFRAVSSVVLTAQVADPGQVVSEPSSARVQDGPVWVSST